MAMTIGQARLAEVLLPVSWSAIVFPTFETKQDNEQSFGERNFGWIFALIPFGPIAGFGGIMLILIFDVARQRSEANNDEAEEKPYFDNSKKFVEPSAETGTKELSETDYGENCNTDVSHEVVIDVDNGIIDTLVGVDT
ncbi:hypothetical protein HG530_015177 [Fusarium avenaceum]|nr:hypothetical protein HG530_015177 [Fusarium avenaceum]